MQKSLTIIFLIAALGGCTWVQLTSDGEQVEVRAANQVAGCERLGRASSTTMDRLILVDRSSERQQEELCTLARNEAANMGGNAIVATNDVSNGRQQFDVYRCP
ncbi:MAG: DUF4156 domain-containing protein [Pseudomonadales bacterium]|nr:DUF4156 domain-containing protein [Pseudomonadales bacterium]